MSDLRTAAQKALEALEIVQADVKTTPNAYETQRQAITTLKAALADGDNLSPTEPVQEPVQEPQLKRIHPLDMPLEVFVEDLSTRPRNIINAEMGYFTHLGDEYIKPPLTVRHLLMFSRKELRKWPNLGKRSLNEIEEMLRNRGLQLWDEHDERSLRLLREHPTYYLRTTVARRREHVTDGTPCWCNSETVYTDPDTGASVIVHREPQ
jgi:DNA-directed RNA polymerase alpha subunit